jgi:hypothetical protein
MWSPERWTWCYRKTLRLHASHAQVLGAPPGLHGAPSAQGHGRQAAVHGGPGHRSRGICCGARLLHNGCLMWRTLPGGVAVADSLLACMLSSHNCLVAAAVAACEWACWEVLRCKLQLLSKCKCEVRRCVCRWPRAPTRRRRWWRRRRAAPAACWFSGRTTASMRTRRPPATGAQPAGGQADQFQGVLLVAPTLRACSKYAVLTSLAARGIQLLRRTVRDARKPLLWRSTAAAECRRLSLHSAACARWQ